MKYNYSDAILKLRVKLNVSQAELAKILGVSLTLVNSWEKGKFEPTLLVKEKLKQLFKDNDIKLEEM